MNSKNKILFLGPAFLFLFTIALIFILNPHWTLMDDAGNLVIVRDMVRDGLWKTSWHWFQIDLYNDGRLRLLSPFMMALLYLPAGANSLIMFTINNSFVFFILVFCAFPFYKSALNCIGNLEKNSFISFFLVTAFCYPWTHYLFYCPSVTEKLVLLFAAIFLGLLYSLVKIQKNIFWLLYLLMPLALAINTKEQIVFFFPLFLAVQLQLDHKRKDYSRVLLLLVLLVLSTALLHWAGTHGEYKARYGLQSALTNLVNFRKSKTLMIFPLLAIITEFCIYLQWRRKRDIFAFLHASAYPAGLVCFVIVMLPWNMGFYLNSSVTIFFIMCCLIILQSAQEWLKKPDLLSFSALALIPLAILVTLLKTGVFYSALGDYRKLLESNELRAVAAQNTNIFMPCEEGAVRTAQYAKMFHNMDLKTTADIPVTPQKILAEGGNWIFSPVVCTNGEESTLLDESKGATILFRGRLKSGFYLVNIKK